MTGLAIDVGQLDDRSEVCFSKIFEKLGEAILTVVHDLYLSFILPMEIPCILLDVFTFEDKGRLIGKSLKCWGY